MSLRRCISIMVLSLVTATPAISALEEGLVVNPGYISDPKVATLSVRSSAGFMAPPVIRLGSDDYIDFNFDILGDDVKYLRCRLVHCNAGWVPSLLLESEFTGSFNEAEISDYAYSTNTYVHYVNYNVRIPDYGLSPAASGNYLLQVYYEDNPDDVILQTGFYVTEDAAVVAGKVDTRTDKGYNQHHQQIEVSAKLLTDVRNPYEDILMAVMQNNSPATLRLLPRPQRVEGSEIIYSHLPDLIFNAGNEYRRFETVRADYPGMGVDSVSFADGMWHAWLSPDSPRADMEYKFDRTQHGRFKVDEYNAEDADLAADYVTVCFTLVDVAPDVRIYLDGDFSMHGKNERYRMAYDSSIGNHTVKIPLKQGSYNYRYVAVDENGNESSSAIEGDRYETDNEYLVLIYLREPGSRADRLLSATVLTL